MRTASLVLAGVTGVVLTAVTLAALAFRTGYRPVLDRVRRFNRAVTNPRQLRDGAGGPGAWASVVEHVGRTSGTTYRTPVGALPDGDARFLVALPYGPDTDWVRNLRAAGGGVVHHDGSAVRVRDPEVVQRRAVAHALAGGAEALAERVFGVDRYLVLHRVDADEPAAPNRSTYGD